jgi:methionyl-tRNA formyltransferase
MSSPEELTLYDSKGARKLGLPWPDVYVTPEYGEADLCTQGEGTTWELALWRFGGEFVAYCYLKRPVLHRGELVGHDLVTPYGYSGPWASEPTPAPVTFGRFRRAFQRVCAERGYAAEFIRFSPLRVEEAAAFEAGCAAVATTADPGGSSPDSGAGATTCWRHQTTVAIDLSHGPDGHPESYWERAGKEHRRCVRKATKRGYKAELRPATASDVAPGSPYQTLYEATMRRLEASGFYFFPPEYYTRLLATGAVFVAVVRRPVGGGGEIAAAAALYLLYGRTFHYHLAGSDRACTPDGVNNLLHDAAARFAAARGCARVHLGGGLRDGDSLFRFKRSVGSVELPWRLGKSVLDRRLHATLLRLRATHLGLPSGETLAHGTTFHPAYRDGLVGNELAPPKAAPGPGDLLLVCCAGNEQRWPALRALADLAASAPLALLVLIPSGGKYVAFGAALGAAGLRWRHARKAEFEPLLAELAPAVVLSLGWPFIFSEGLLSGARTPEKDAPPPTTFLNSHPSLLPKHRGSSPFAAAILAGDTSAGCTVHRIDSGVDTGPTLVQQAFALTPFDTYGSVKARSFDLEARCVREALERLLGALSSEEGAAAAARVDALFTPQVASGGPVTPRRSPSDSEIDPSLPLGGLYAAIRCCDPERFPAFFYWEGQRVNIKLWREERPADAHPESL